jgi:hypothetical protein
VSPSNRRTSPEGVVRIVAYAREHEHCGSCGAAPGDPCDRPGPGRAVCKSRYIAAAIKLNQQAKAARRTPEQAAILAGLPRVSAGEIEAARSPRGGWTRETLAAWGIPWPPPAGWLQALLREEDGSDDS